MSSWLHTLSLGLAKKPDTPPGVDKYASFNQRMLAATIDSVIGMLTIAPLIDAVMGAYSPLPAVDWAAIRALIPPQATNAEANRIIAQQLAASGFLAHWLVNMFLQSLALAVVVGVCWHFWSATPGKLLLRLKLVDAKSEENISDKQIALRLLGYALSTLPLFSGFFWIGIDKRRQGWHDKLAGTVVIRLPKKQGATPASEAAAPSGSPAPSAKE